MDDPKETTTLIHNSSKTQEPFFKKNLPLLIGGGGCLFFLCVILLVGGGFLLGKMGSSDKLPVFLAGSDDADLTPETTTTFTPSPTAPFIKEEPTASPTSTPGKPEIGSIVFALNVMNDTEPVDAASSFEAGITKVHAVFEYSNLSGDDVWERVWSLDGTEMLRSTENWGSDRSGTFDYFLDAGDDPLPPGLWQLDLYLNDELLSSGSFTIQSAVTATPAPSATPRQKTTPTATVLPSPSPASVVASDKVYQLVYPKWQGDHNNIYMANTNGAGEKLIVTSASGPSWSLDGKQLFFYGEQGVTQQVRVGTEGCEFGTISDGIVAIDLPNSPGDICQPKSGTWYCERKNEEGQAPSDVCTEGGVRVFQNLDWKVGSARWTNVAPDGAAVMFDAKPGGDDYRIYFRSILNNQQNRFELTGEQADWSPDGQKLVYRSGRDNKQGIWISNRDDTGHIRITDGGKDSFPAWSPNGRTIAFSREVGGNVDIYLVNTDGSNLRRLTTAEGPDTLPVFAPNGSLIFRSARTGSWGIWKMAIDGSGQREIIAHADVGPDWSYSRMDVR